MKTCRALFVAIVDLFLPNVVLAVPNLKMPFPAGEIWTMTRGYDQDTHVNYATSTTQDKYALDFVLPGCNAYGKPALAVASGVVEFAGLNGGYGNTVVVNHGNSYKSRYAHFSEISVRVNDVVSQGQEVGKMGNTGNVSGSSCAAHPGTHLHFVMYYNGQALKPEPISGNTNVGNIDGALFFSDNYHPGETNVDSYCQKVSPNYLVERFRSSGGNLVVNACPSDGRVYYYKDVSFGSCNVGYIDLFANTDGAGGYKVCTGSNSGSPGENYGSDPSVGSGGSSSNPSAQTDLTVSPKEYPSGSDRAYDEGSLIVAGTTLDLIATTKVTNGDVSLGMKSGDTKVTIRGEVSYGDGSWTQVGDDQGINKDKLTKGAWVPVSWKYTVPASIADGTAMRLRFTTDLKNVVLEKYEDNNQKTEVFTVSAVPHQRTPEERKRFYHKFFELLLDD